MNEFKPDWVSPPGDTMRDILEERGLDSEWFGREMGLSSGETDALLRGDACVTPTMAERLAEVLGSTAQFWVTREAHFRGSLPITPRSDSIPS